MLVAFVDDTFNLFPKRVIEICHGIIEKKLDLWWWCLSRIDLLLRNEEMVKEMVRAGAKSVFIGVESSNPKTLEQLKKGIDVEDTVQAVEMLKRNGLEIHAAYILGGLDETVERIHETIRFAKRLDTNVAQFSILTPYPGTAIYEQVKNRIFKWRSPWSFFDMQHLVFKHDHLSFYPNGMASAQSAPPLLYPIEKSEFRISGIISKNIIWASGRFFVF